MTDATGMGHLRVRRQDASLRTISLEWLPLVALMMYFVRDALGGFFRYYTQIFHVSEIWFIPDLLAFACIPYFIYKAVWLKRNATALATVLVVTLYIIIGGLFLGSSNATFSSIKMITPIFVGFCFYDRSIGEHPKSILLLEALLYLSIVGVVVSSYVRMPWIGFSFESFGAAKTAGRLWWSAHDERLSGFAADNTMAALFILLTFVVTSFRRHYAWCLLVGMMSVYAIELTTSKTSLVSLILYMICLTICRVLQEHNRFMFVRLLALSSFALSLVPLVFIIFLSGLDLTSINSTLFSMQDRINNSWQLPFVYMIQLFPQGVVLGCGVGCFNYPQLEFSQYAAYWVPEDNFYLGTYTMFGVSFVLFVAKVFEAMRHETDIYKLVLIFVMNVFTVTVLSYGPATGLIVIALCFSTVFGGARGASAESPQSRPSHPMSTLRPRVTNRYSLK